MGLEAGGEFGIVDKVIEELVPGLGRETCIAEHVRQFFHAITGQRGDGVARRLRSPVGVNYDGR